MDSKFHGVAAGFLIAALCLLPIWDDANANGTVCLILAAIINITGFLAGE